MPQTPNLSHRSSPLSFIVSPSSSPMPFFSAANRRQRKHHNTDHCNRNLSHRFFCPNFFHLLIEDKESTTMTTTATGISDETTTGVSEDHTTPSLPRDSGLEAIQCGNASPGIQEEAKITELENLQKAKAEAAIRKQKVFVED
ncbi:hypothetical protein RHSIM_Rhsim12G0084600 [Rhododendron simsii]|uniref:Uncharacterized protein n=1 Tax=Rhododendron simsii TaxID=118357 RepID=A0A834L5Y5_RHOSS|nr:hypothetical protein RHSIM_Rhsim12G0084600 [Rhododendron simsii]